MISVFNVALVLTLYPVGGNYYYAFMLLGLASALLIRRHGIILPNINNIVLWVAAWLLIPSLAWSAINMRDFSGLRQYIYVVLALLFLANPGPRLSRAVVHWFGIAVAAVIICDFFLLYLDIGGMGEKFLMLAVNQSFQDYVGAYYRYLGLLGSPNLSGILYALFAINQIIFYKRFSNPLFIVGSMLAMCLMVLTFSRTAWVSFFVALVFSKEVNIRNYVLVILPLAVLYSLVFEGTDSGDVFLSRLSDFSSGNERTAIARDVFQQLDLSDVMLGSPNVPFVLDNDYLLLFFRFGLLGFLSWALILATAFLRGRRMSKAGVIPFYLIFFISGLSGGAIGSPSLSFAVLLCIWTYLAIDADDSSTVRDVVPVPTSSPLHGFG